MSPPPCIHGFPADQCSSCRPCPHGLTVARCGQCSSTTRSTAASRNAATPSPPSEQHRGYEIFYVPEVSGWQYRDPDERASDVSYRSAFLARKAVDAAAAAAEAKAARAAAKPA